MIRISAYIFIFLCITAGEVNSQVNTERDRITDKTEGLSVSLDLRMRVASGNVEIVDIGNIFKPHFRRGPHLTYLILDVQYATKRSSTFINRGFIHIRYNYSFNNPVTWEVFTQHEYNEFTRLFSRTLFGSGARIQLFADERIGVFFASTYMLEHEHIDVAPLSGDASRTRAHRLSNYFTFSWKISESAKISNTLYVQTRFDAPDDMRILNQMALRVDINDHFSLVLSMNLRYDSLPPTAVKKTDFEIGNGISIEF